MEERNPDKKINKEFTPEVQYCTSWEETGTLSVFFLVRVLSLKGRDGRVQKKKFSIFLQALFVLVPVALSDDLLYCFLVFFSILLWFSWFRSFVFFWKKGGGKKQKEGFGVG